MWSETEPATSRVASSVTAYTVNAVVSCQAGKPHSCWYSTKSGLPAPAPKATAIEAVTTPKVARGRPEPDGWRSARRWGGGVV